MAIAQLLQQRQGLCSLLRLLLSSERWSGGKATAMVVPNTRQQLLDVPGTTCVTFHTV